MKAIDLCFVGPPLTRNCFPGVALNIGSQNVLGTIHFDFTDRKLASITFVVRNDPGVAFNPTELQRQSRRDTHTGTLGSSAVRRWSGWSDLPPPATRAPEVTCISRRDTAGR